MRVLLATLALAVVLSGCTMFYTRNFGVEPTEKLSAAEVEKIFHSYRDFLISKGLRPQNYGGKDDPNQVAFQIGGSNAGFGLRRDWADTLALSYSPQDGFRLYLSRIVHHPADFSDEYLKSFIEQTEKLVHEATSKTVRIALIEKSPNMAVKRAAPQSARPLP
jgi:hypothetical protein